MGIIGYIEASWSILLGGACVSYMLSGKGTGMYLASSDFTHVK